VTAISFAAWIADGDFTTVDGHRMWYRTFGSSQHPQLLFLHGYPTSSHDWLAVVAELQNDFHCVVVDLLGFGASAKPRTNYTLAQQMRVVLHIAKHTQLTAAIVVAHDYSVTLAQLLLCDPQRYGWLRGVVFLNGGLNSALHHARPIQRFLASSIGQLVGPFLMNRRTFETSMRRVIKRSDDVNCDEIWQCICHNDGAKLLPRLLHYIAERQQRHVQLIAALDNATVPLSFVWGQEDPVSGSHVSQWLKHRYPRANIKLVGGVGHYPQLEDPTSVVDAVLAMAHLIDGDVAEASPRSHAR
jgi:pimeloyl-ACP methyl ester carboxylesterase